jgi:hypothetical protein
MAISAKRASTLGQVLEATAQIRNTWNPSYSKDQDLWFRGHPKRSFQLQPGLYRPSVEKYKYDEYTLLTTFKNLGDSYLSRGLVSSWDWYFLAQHYRLPTRLLDWTESLLASVYFALASEIEGLERRVFDELLRQPQGTPVFDDTSPTVWILDAGSLNHWAVGEDGIFAPGNDQIEGYCWDKIHESCDPGEPPKDKPIALTPPRQNPRIVAQRGMFTVHGTSRLPIDDIASSSDPTDLIKLGCIVLDRSNLASIWDELEVAGVGRLTLFPELDSVAEHIKWVYQSY